MSHPLIPPPTRQTATPSAVREPTTTAPRQRHRPPDHHRDRGGGLGAVVAAVSTAGPPKHPETSRDMSPPVISPPTRQTATSTWIRRPPPFVAAPSRLCVFAVPPPASSRPRPPSRPPALHRVRGGGLRAVVAAVSTAGPLRHPGPSRHMSPAVIPLPARQTATRQPSAMSPRELVRDVGRNSKKVDLARSPSGLSARMGGLSARMGIGGQGASSPVHLRLCTPPSPHPAAASAPAMGFPILSILLILSKTTRPAASSPTPLRKSAQIWVPLRQIPIPPPTSASRPAQRSPKPNPVNPSQSCQSRLRLPCLPLRLCAFAVPPP
jgi:hypothetical protein